MEETKRYTAENDERIEKGYGGLEEDVDSKGKNDKPAKQVAIEKLKKELKEAKEKNFAEPVIGYLLKRCEEDKGLAQDVIQEHKTWKKCFDYIYEQAHQQATGNIATVRDVVVYEWAEDYFHLDDKALEEKKAREEAERKRKAAEKKKQDAEEKGKTASEKSAVSKPQCEVQKLKHKKNEVDGQIDFFSMMGM